MDVLSRGTNSEGQALTMFGDDTVNMDGEIVEFVSYQAQLSQVQIAIEMERLAAKHAELGL